MAALGSFVLLATFVVASYALAASVAGGRRRSNALIESGVGAFYTTGALMTVASGILVHAFVTGNYAVKYVQRYWDAAQPLVSKITSSWGGLDGSIMFWVFLLSGFGRVAVAGNRERHRELIPWVVAIIAAVEMFFIFIMVVHNNPFETFVAGGPADGKGLNPLLQNFYMAIHPPSLYTGFVAMTIPYAFGMAALIPGHLDDAWLRAVRRGAVAGWLFLPFGVTPGLLSAYDDAGRAGPVAFGGWGLPGKYLDPGVLGVLRPLRQDVPDARQGGGWAGADGRPAVLQPVDAPDRPGAARADGHRAAARLAEVHADE